MPPGQGLIDYPTDATMREVSVYFYRWLTRLMILVSSI